MLVKLGMRILALKKCVHKIIILVFGIQDKIKNKNKIVFGINIQDMIIIFLSCFINGG